MFLVWGGAETGEIRFWMVFGDLYLGDENRPILFFGRRSSVVSWAQGLLIRRLEQKLLLCHDIPAGYFYFIIFVVFLAEILPRMNFLTLM